tara:strand:- start:6644 stop:7264 length:621 start_codon:yes stop_codon:yes gene_type:complete
MGSINRFNIAELMERYHLKNYVESGTGSGTCLEFVMQYPFDSFHSIEIYKEVYDKAIEKFVSIQKLYDRECNIILGNSYEVLPSILTGLKAQENTLFFLDAHFPGADFGHQKHGDEKNADKRIPLEREIETIVKNRDTSRDVIIADDLRIYEDGPYAAGNWSDRKLIGGSGIDFVEKHLGETHKMLRDYRDQGYILLVPHEVKEIE